MGNIEKENHGLNINMIGESLYLFNLYLSRNIYTKSEIKTQKNSIFDFCNFNYKFNRPIEEQIKNVFSMYQKNKEEKKINSKEVLIVQTYKFNDINKKIYKEMGKLEETHYMPLVLFLVDYKRDLCPEEEYYEEDLNYPEEGKDYVYNLTFLSNNKIDDSLIFFLDFIYNREYLLESEEKEFTDSGDYKFEKIKNILLRFYSYHNDLGDIFSIGKGNNKINYDLTQYYYLNTFNICCIGRNGSGKSIFINFILHKTRAKVFNKRETFTKKVNCYSEIPDAIKLFEIPGFNNKISAQNSTFELLNLNKELDEIKDELHVILYFFKSNENSMFNEDEYQLLKAIPNQKNLKIIFIITNSSQNIKKGEIIEKIIFG